MYTFNFKVLFNDIKSAVLHAGVIWSITNFVGTIVLSASDVIGLPFYQLLLLGLVFSTPSLLVLIPAFLLQPDFPTGMAKVLYILSVTLLCCIAVICFFLVVTNGYPLDKQTTLAILSPYAISAVVIAPPSIAFLSTKRHNNKINS